MPPSQLIAWEGHRLGVPLCKCTVKKFSDNETYAGLRSAFASHLVMQAVSRSVSIGESVREEDVYILQVSDSPMVSTEGADQFFS